MNTQLGDYIFIKNLGKGSFGDVFLTKKANSPQLYATKKIPISNLKREKFAQYLKNEINIMKILGHKNIVKLHEVIKRDKNIYIIMEYINGGTLLDYLTSYKKMHNDKPFPQKIIQYFLKQIVDGLIHIHSKNVLHRDIKLENILLNFPPEIKKENRDYTQAQIKIIDFGLSTQLRHFQYKDKDKKILAQSAVGTPMYMDPIILSKYDKYGGIKKYQLYDEKCDIWSLGAITYEMLTGQNLFQAKNMTDLLNKIKKGNYFLNVNELSSEIISFLNCMLQYKPEKRLSAQELAKHQFLTKNPDDFTKADVTKIDYKIVGGRLILNIFDNNTIGMLFPFKPENMINSLTMNLDEISKDLTTEKPNTNIKQNSPPNKNIGSENKKQENAPIIHLKTKSTKDVNGADIAKITDKGGKNFQQNLLKKTFNNLSTNNLNLNKIDSKKINGQNLQKNKGLKIKFNVERVDKIKENVLLNIKFLVTESNILYHKSNLKTENCFKDEWIWQIDNNIWKNIDINNNYFVVYAEIIKNNLNEVFCKNVETITLGKPTGFTIENYINIILIPI